MRDSPEYQEEEETTAILDVIIAALKDKMLQHLSVRSI